MKPGSNTRVCMVSRTLIVVIITAGFLASACATTRAPALVTVQNMASETIASLSVEVSDEKLSAHDLRPGQSVTLNFSIGVESEYYIVAKFVSGRIVEKHVGYVDAGLNSHDYLDVYKDDVGFKAYMPRVSSPSSASQIHRL